MAHQQTAAFGLDQGPGQRKPDPVGYTSLGATGEHGLGRCVDPVPFIDHVDGQTPSDVVGVDRHGACAVLHGIGYEHVENLVQGRP